MLKPPTSLSNLTTMTPAYRNLARNAIAAAPARGAPIEL